MLMPGKSVRTSPLKIPVDARRRLAPRSLPIVPNQNAPDGWTRESLERVTGLSASSGRVQRQRAGPDVADMQAGLADDQLPLRVDDAERARHEGQIVDDRPRRPGMRFSSSFLPRMSNQKSLSDCGS